MLRKLRCVIGEGLVETGQTITWLGRLILPARDSYPGFASNGDLDRPVEGDETEILYGD